MTKDERTAEDTVMHFADRTGIRTSILILLALLCLPLMAAAQTGEYTVKAVYLERFTRFVEWPEGAAIEDTTESFVIAVLGEHPFGDTLDEVYGEQ